MPLALPIAAVGMSFGLLALANTRFLPMGFALAPSMSGGPLGRLLRPGWPAVLAMLIAAIICALLRLAA